MTAAIDTAYDRLRASDTLVAKAAKLFEVAQIARLEVRLREYLEAKWQARAEEAAARARARTLAGDAPANVARAVDAVMEKWASDVEAIFTRDLGAIYNLAFIAGWRKATGRTGASLQYDGDDLRVTKAKKADVSSDFSLEDQGAVDALKRQNMFWVGKHYGDNVSKAVSQTARETIVAGKSRRVAGEEIARRMREELGKVSTPSGYRGSARSYFEGVAANAATVARAFGQLNSFKAIGVTRYVIVNPLDERTCPVCGHMNGKVFEVKDGLAQMNRLIKAKSPEQVKKAHPWLSAGALKKVSPTPGLIKGKAGKADSKRLADSGQALPPYHFKCRCTCDIDDSSFSFDALSEAELEAFAGEAEESSYSYDESEWKKRVKEMNAAEDKTGPAYAKYTLKLVSIADVDVPRAWSKEKLKQVLDALDGGKKLPPIRASVGDGGKLIIQDGIHRANASLARGYTHIPALIDELIER